MPRKPMYLEIDKIEPDECDLYLFWSSPSNTGVCSGGLINYTIDVNGAINTSQDNMIMIPYEHRCDQLDFNATIQATNECNMTSLKASFENIRGNESNSIPSKSLSSSCPDASKSQNIQPETSDISSISSTQLSTIIPATCTCNNNITCPPPSTNDSAIIVLSIFFSLSCIVCIIFAAIAIIFGVILYKKVCTRL